ncbi:MAG: glucose 1-dehydrogenase [Gammaproteobacteria bacterium]|nr:glucose 1-dehydrogenase [Gammaproteobacteria bacterium]MDH3448081.1 glucose 1-dehydrogenase [Gammaproteobacteria bacterium]
MSLKRLQDRVCIVTGAASGIGRAIAIRFAREGARVVILDPRDDPVEGGESTLDCIRGEGGEVTAQVVDVSNWAELDLAVTKTIDAFGALHVMVNNAAIYTGGNLLQTTQDDWDRVMAVNLRGVFNGCKRAVQQMLTQPPLGEARGRIVNISSQHGMIACPGDIAYGVSKAGVVYITRQIAADYAAQGIVCNAVAPGKILTGRSDAIDEASMNYARSRTPMAAAPLGRLGKPADVASAALFLASDECSYVNGANLMVDGGWTAA